MIAFDALTVLVMDPNARAPAAATVLEGRGATVLHANTVSEALELLLSIAIDVVLIDAHTDIASALGIRTLRASARSGAVVVASSLTVLPAPVRDALTRVGVDAMLPVDCDADLLASIIADLTASRA